MPTSKRPIKTEPRLPALTRAASLAAPALADGSPTGLAIHAFLQQVVAIPDTRVAYCGDKYGGKIKIIHHRDTEGTERETGDPNRASRVILSWASHPPR